MVIFLFYAAEWLLIHISKNITNNFFNPIHQFNPNMSGSILSDHIRIFAFDLMAIQIKSIIQLEKEDFLNFRGILRGKSNCYLFFCKQNKVGNISACFLLFL